MTKRDLPLRLLRRLHAWTEERIKARHLKIYCHDRMCPNCKRWGALGGWSECRDVEPMHEDLVCRVCGHVSRWCMAFMLPVLSPTRPAGDDDAARTEG